MNKENYYYLTGGSTDTDTETGLKLIDTISNLKNIKIKNWKKDYNDNRITRDLVNLVNKSNWVLFHETLTNIFESILKRVVIIDNQEEVRLRIKKTSEYMRLNPDVTVQYIGFPYNYNIATNELEFVEMMGVTNLSLIPEWLKMIKADEESIILQLETKPFNEITFTVDKRPGKLMNLSRIYKQRFIEKVLLTIFFITNENIDPFISEIKNLLFNFIDPINHPINNTITNLSNNIINTMSKNDSLYELIWIVSIYVIEILIFMLIYYIQKNI